MSLSQEAQLILSRDLRCARERGEDAVAQSNVWIHVEKLLHRGEEARGQICLPRGGGCGHLICHLTLTLITRKMHIICVSIELSGFLELFGGGSENGGRGGEGGGRGGRKKMVWPER